MVYGYPDRNGPERVPPAGASRDANALPRSAILGRTLRYLAAVTVRSAAVQSDLVTSVPSLNV